MSNPILPIFVCVRTDQFSITMPVRALRKQATSRMERVMANTHFALVLRCSGSCRGFGSASKLHWLSDAARGADTRSDSRSHRALCECDESAVPRKQGMRGE